MKHLGIDYGTKKVGIAISDASGMIAFPKNIISQSANFLNDIVNLITEESIQKVVVGRSLNGEGNDNTVQKKIDDFVTDLQGRLDGIEVVQQDERGSSVAARSHLYGKGNIANVRWTGKENQKKREAVDAQAAAVILQRYLDTKKDLG
jgi:putative Holliday junction resolvase